VNTVRRVLATLAGAALSLAALSTVQPAEALSLSTYYVSATGSDAAAGTAQAPWRTIAKATAAAPAGATILVGSGSYAPFAVTKPLQTVAAQSGASVRVVGTPGARDVVRIRAAGVTLRGFTVTGCVPVANPAGGYDQGGSSAVRVDDGADGVTVTGLTIRDSRGTNEFGLPFGCYGILAHGANATTITGNDISGTGTGVYLNGGGRLSIVSGNTIHDNDVLIRNTPGGDDDYGANAITFANLDALPAAVASGNTITGNAGPSADYGTDGGAFEIYNSSHVQMLGNTIRDNENVLETGTSPDGNYLLGACVGNTFSGNTVSGRTAGSRLERSVGLILRCATGMVVADNSFHDVDWYVYDISTDDKFASDVVGLAITGNRLGEQFQKVYHLDVDPLASLLVVDANRFGFTGPVFASYGDGSTSASLADWQRRTHLDQLAATG
jgi:parallel beta-helix repeat protein